MMRPKRTPPAKTSGDSDAHLSSTAASDTENEDTRNAAYRSRSRKRGHDDELNIFMSEITQMITDLKEEQNHKLDELQSSINDIRKQNAGIIESVEYLSNEYKVLRKQLEDMENDRKRNMDYIQLLENKVDLLETSHKSSCIEIKNIPPKQKESKQDLLDVIGKLGTALNLPIQTSNIRDVFRINTKKEGNKPIIVDFTSIIVKDSVIEHCKKFNNQHRENKLNTTHLHISGPPNNIYISEHLTAKARRLFFLARDFASTNEYKYCWTAGGKIFIRKREGERHLRVTTEADLDKLKTERKM